MFLLFRPNDIRVSSVPELLPPDKRNRVLETPLCKNSKPQVPILSVTFLSKASRPEKGRLKFRFPIRKSAEVSALASVSKLLGLVMPISTLPCPNTSEDSQKDPKTNR